MIARPCIVAGCNALVANGARCPAHRRAQRQKYAGDWPRRARRAIAIYRALRGDTCPGWKREPHAIDPDEWTVDHEHGPMCRSCNTRKMRLGHG